MAHGKLTIVKFGNNNSLTQEHIFYVKTLWVGPTSLDFTIFSVMELSNNTESLPRCAQMSELFLITIYTEKTLCCTISFCIVYKIRLNPN